MYIAEIQMYCTMKRCSIMNLFDLLKDWELSFIFFEILEKFTCMLYAPKQTTSWSMSSSTSFVRNVENLSLTNASLSLLPAEPHSAQTSTLDYGNNALHVIHKNFLTQSRMGEKLITRLLMIF
jgi:hypothetical protein